MGPTLGAWKIKSDVRWVAEDASDAAGLDTTAAGVEMSPYMN